MKESGFPVPGDGSVALLTPADSAGSPDSSGPAGYAAPASCCDVCANSSTCSWCRGEGYDLSRSAGMQPCGLCGGSGACTFCPLVEERHPFSGG